MNTDMKKMVDRLKGAQAKVQKFVKQQDWVEEARRYAERQGVEVKKLLSTDGARMKAFVERERKELERLKKVIPGEVKKFRELLVSQRDEFEKILRNVKRKVPTGGRKSADGGKKSSRSKRSGGRKSSAS